MDIFVEFTINLLTLWFWMWCCDELSLSGLDIVSPFNEIPESMGPSIDCGRELDPSTCNTKNKQTNWATCFLNHYDIIWCPFFQSKFSRQSCCTDKLFKLDMVIGPLIVFLHKHNEFSKDLFFTLYYCSPYLFIPHIHIFRRMAVINM